MIRPLAVLACIAVVAALAVPTPDTLAEFTSLKSAAATLGTDTLRPPTGVAGTGGSSASLAWTASTSSAATGYNLLRSGTSGSGYTQVKTVTPVSATSTDDAPGSGTWYYVLDSYLGGWTSAYSSEASVTVDGSPTSTAVVGCASEAPETVNAGDDNGYETNPAYACDQDHRVAIDANSGTDKVLSCPDPGKDRERFWGYSFGLPGTVSSIDGITVQLVMGLNNRAGTSQVCVELSWDGGTSWTAPQTVTMTKAPLTAYTVGTATDTWGHTGWTTSQLGTSSFRVRLTDMSTTASKTFSLDFLGVRVDYTP